MGAKRYGLKYETFDNLRVYATICDITRKGKSKLGQKTSRKKFRQKMKDMNTWLKGIRNRETF
ncbi:MAG: hypothetical protein C5S47_04545 [Candidatus Methanogasteraceae archaeon]|nr:MAG: hypothetical protein C5S47_04545 [ANME-2 cluster archaeon]